MSLRPNRTSKIGYLDNTALSSPAVLEIGDSGEIAPVNQTLAVQRQKAIFYQNEFLFRDYPMFFWPQALPVPNENVQITAIQESPVINVIKMKIFSVADSSVIHIGSSVALRADSRIKNIRHLLREKPPEA